MGHVVGKFGHGTTVIPILHTLQHFCLQNIKLLPVNWAKLKLSRMGHLNKNIDTPELTIHLPGVSVGLLTLLTWHMETYCHFFLWLSPDLRKIGKHLLPNHLLLEYIWSSLSIVCN